MNENMKSVELLTVADFQAHPVWEFVNDDEIGEMMMRPVKNLPVENLDGRLIGTRVHLANDSQVWAFIGNFNATHPRANEHFMTLSIERDGKWFHLARYHDVGFAARSPDMLAQFLGLSVDDVFPIVVDVRRYVRGSPAALTTIVMKEPREKLTREERWALR